MDQSGKYEVGDQIGKYEVQGILGRGGFGTVYRAYDPDMKRVVAIKVLKFPDDEALVKRFQTEIEIAASLRHKNIVTVYTFEKVQGALVMECLEGKDLRSLIDERVDIPMFDKLLIMGEAAEGLQYAHEHTVIHRDVKPGNIMKLASGSAKIMDFGISRLRGANTGLTQTGYMVGTPEYMAPEQFSSDVANEKCDVWSYGVVFFEFLSGTNPFRADDPVQVMYKVNSWDPPPISSAADVPRGLDLVFQRLLARSTKLRYGSLEEVRLDLEPLILDQGRIRAEVLLERADKLVADGGFNEALALARRAAELDRRNEKAARLIREVREIMRRQTTEVQVRFLLQQADLEISRKDYGAAVKALEDALNLDGDNETVRSRLEGVRAIQERMARAAAMVASARRELEQEALTSAFEHASEAAKADPDNDEALRLVADVRRAIDERDKELRRRAGLSRAKGHILVQEYASAVVILKALAEEHPEDQEVRDALAEAARLADAYTVQQKVDTAVTDARELLKRGDYERAINILGSLDNAIPQAAQVGEMMRYARQQLDEKIKESEVQRLLDDATACLKQKNYTAALELADQALHLSSDHERASRVKRSISAAIELEEEYRSIAQIVEECRAVLLSGRLEKAEETARELKSKYQDHPDVITLWAEIEQQIKAKQQRYSLEVKARVEEIEKLLRENQVEMAKSLVDSLRIQYPDEPVFRELQGRIIRLLRDRRDFEQVNAVLGRVRDLTRAKRYDESLSELDRALATRSGRPELLEERKRVEREKTVDGAATDIQQQLSRGEFDAAIASAESVLRRIPGEARIQELLERAHRLREFKDLLSQATSLVTRRDIDRAEQLLQKLNELDPRNPAVKQLEENISSEKKRQAAFAAADQFRKRREFSGARKIAASLVEEYPDDATARALLEAIEQEWADYEKQQAESKKRQRTAQVRLDVEKLLDAKRYGEAVALLERLHLEFPDDQSVAEDLAQATQKRAYADGRAEFQQLMKQGRFEEARRWAKQLEADFPNDFQSQDLRSVDQALALRERDQDVDAAIRVIEEHRRKGEDEAVRRLASELLKEYEDPRARALLEGSEKRLAEARIIRRETGGRRLGPVRIAALAALPVAALLIYMVLKFAPSRPTQFAVDRSDMSFSYRQGDTPPLPQSFHVRGSAFRSSVTNAPWITLSDDSHADGGDVTVWVDPKKLSPGNYFGQVTVGSNKRAAPPLTVDIRMHINPASPEPPTVAVTPSPSQIVASTKELSFYYRQGDPLPPGQVFVVQNAPKGTKWTAAVSDSWFAAGVNGDSIRVFSQRKLNAGDYSGTVTISAPNATLIPTTVTVRLHVDPPLPTQTKQPKKEPPPPPTQTSTAPPPQTASAPLVEPPVNCHAADYTGLRQSKVAWLGALEPGRTVTITRHDRVVDGFRVQGTLLPGCDITLSKITDGIEPIEKPTQDNGFGKVTLRNNRSTPILSPAFQWDVK